MPVNNDIPYPDRQRSDMFRELLTTSPGVMLRAGPSVFLGTLLLILSIAWLIRYPDMVTTSARLTSENGPRELKMIISGRIEKIVAVEDSWVNQGEPIVMLETTADVQAVLYMYERLDSLGGWLEQGKYMQVQDLIEKLDSRRFGELQDAWYRLYGQWLQFCQYLPGGRLQQRERMVMADKEILKKQKQQLWRQVALAEMDTQMARLDFTAETILYDEKVLSPFEFRAARSRVNARQQGFLQLESLLLANDVQQQEKQKELLELSGQKKQQGYLLMAEIRQMRSLTDKWLATYLLRAPVSGKLYFTRTVLPGEWLAAGESICRVAPEKIRYMGTMYVPQGGIGMVETGQAVHLLLAAYPVQQFGHLTGIVGQIAKVPSDSGYFALVLLPDTLKTQSGYHVPYREGMIGEARIITKERRLLERFYDQVTMLFER